MSDNRPVMTFILIIMKFFMQKHNFTFKCKKTCDAFKMYYNCLKILKRL